MGPLLVLAWPSHLFTVVNFVVPRNCAWASARDSRGNKDISTFPSLAACQ